MAKPAVSDAIMTPEKMKPLLAFSKREPVGAAIGLTADGDAVLLLGKKTKPKKVFGALRGAATKARMSLNLGSLRYGRVEVDPEKDSGTVHFTLNKEPPGVMRGRLTELIRRIPFQKIEIVIDPGLEDEGEEEEAAPVIVPPAQQVLIAAKNTVDQQISGLTSAFLATDHPMGDLIARQGLPGLARGLLTNLEAVLNTRPGGEPDPAAQANAIGDLLSLIEGHPILPVLERNPFGVPVTIRGTLNTALQTLRETILASLNEAATESETAAAEAIAP